MGIIAWIVIGLIAGFLAKMVMPGTSKEPGGFIGTAILGIVGALIGGFIFGRDINNVGLTSILSAVVGACIVVGIARLVSKGTNNA